MSIIIRLQNLPLSARSGDIRNFFGGLRIPDGGVHILGGDNGDAFIAFMSDEDARLAMRKDGGKIKGARVKLFLSSYMEMQHEVGKITKSNLVDSPIHEMHKETYVSGSEFTRGRSPERRRRSYSRSPIRYNDRSYKSRPIKEHERSLSPVVYNSRYRSRSPRRSKSPVRSFPTRISPSKSKKFIQKNRSISPKAQSFDFFAHELEETVNSLSPFPWEHSEHRDHPSRSQIQSQLEKRITDELEKNIALQNILSYDPQGFRVENRQSDILFPHTPAISNEHHFQDAKFRQENMINQFMHSDGGEQDVNKNFYIAMSGLDPQWNFREVQMILKGVFAPQYNIRWEKKNGSKTGRVFVKLSNPEDFGIVLGKGAFIFQDKKIPVSKCSPSIIRKYFRSNFGNKNEQHIPQDGFCYMLKGLPFSCTYDDVVNFFQGLEIADILIIYGEDGRAKGTGFVSFTNWKDFERAMMQNGKKIGHRYIELLPSTEKDMSEAKKTHSDGLFVPYSKFLFDKRPPLSSRPLCAVLTGLPLNVSTQKIASFFAESDLKPDAIHLTLNEQKLPDRRAFVEFYNFLDFDLALKFHGKRLDGNMICVKQILYDEMIKILDSQRAKHDFRLPDNAASVSNEPEKVPYLWEPPDEEQEIVDIPSPRKGFENLSNARGNFAKNVPQFNKQSIINQQTHKPFHSTKKYEENIKLSRLSPENEAALLDFLNKDRKPLPGSLTEQMSEGSKDYKMLPKSRTKDFSKNKSEKDTKHFDELKYDTYHRNPIQSDPLHFQKDRIIMKDKSKECVVQITNVSTTAESDVILNFLKGFDFYKETMIRGYTSEGEPTPDVRVTFCNRREAERAIKALNKCYIQDKRVSLFVV